MKCVGIGFKSRAVTSAQRSEGSSRLPVEFRSIEKTARKLADMPLAKLVQFLRRHNRKLNRFSRMADEWVAQRKAANQTAFPDEFPASKALSYLRAVCATAALTIYHRTNAHPAR